MLMRRCTAAQSAEIRPFCVHLSMCVSLLYGTTDSPLAPGLAVQLCLLHPRQYISLCISQNASCFGISVCSCTAVNRMYGHGSLTCDWPQCACQCMGQFTASAPTNQSPFGRGMLLTVSQWWHAVPNRVSTFLLFRNLLYGTTDSPFAPGLAVQLCLLHPRQYISLCILQNTSCFGISGCSCTAVHRMYGHGSLTCDWPQCACQCMGQFTASVAATGEISHSTILRCHIFRKIRVHGIGKGRDREMNKLTGANNNS